MFPVNTNTMNIKIPYVQFFEQNGHLINLTKQKIMINRHDHRRHTKKYISSLKIFTSSNWAFFLMLLS